MYHKFFTFLLFKTSLSIGLTTLSIDLNRVQTIDFEPRTKGSIDESRGGTSRAVLDLCENSFLPKLGTSLRDISGDVY